MPRPDQITLRAPEVRTFATLEFRETDTSDSGKYLEGRAVPYGEWTDVGWFMEQFSRGAFAKSIREAAKDLPLLLWHDNRSFPVGKAEKWTEGGDGLDAVWRMDTEDPLAVEATRKAKGGFLTGLSVGFAPMPERDTLTIDDDGLPWITRNEARLLEVSLTPTPAYAGAQVALVRSRTAQGNHAPAPRRSAELDSWKRKLEGWRA